MMNEKRHANLPMNDGFVPNNAMEKVLSHENCVNVHDILSLLLYFAGLLLFFFFENTDWLPLSRRSDDSRNLILPFV